MRIHLGYPSPDDESRVIKQQPSRTNLLELEPLMSTEEIESAQNFVDGVTLADSLIKYIIALSTATRQADDLQVGISTRGGLALAQVAKATALLNNRDYCIPEDVVSNVLPVCAHRIVSKTYMHDGDSNATYRIMQQILESVPSPT